ncbi:DUF6271 family protein [Kitasatospora sp. NPDC002227]|uniref:DUF6271 family protein n=1 Tax=Kitasatospora sp. NPDC002227 TaxID=3154773 RepID=UPI003329A0E8
MRRVCLTLPTNRACAPAIAELAAEAAYGAAGFGVEVHLLILDSAAPAALAEHRRAVAALPPAPGVVVHHLDEDGQRAVLRAAAGPRILDLLLPARISYGACTDRAFLLAEHLGCTSVHRRDSDSRYQLLDGAPVYPIHAELTALGRPAAEVAPLVTRSKLDPAASERPVALVGGSFIGELSVDVAEIKELDPAVHRELVGLTLPPDCPPLWRDHLIEQAFTGAGTTPYTAERTMLTAVSPTQVDLCNIAFDRRLYGRVPLPPATDTIGSDYFLLHLARHAGLPGVVHNRHIVNFHTGERRSDAGFLAYQLRLARYLLAVPYWQAVYARLAEAGPELLDGEGAVRAEAVAGYTRESTGLAPAAQSDRLDQLAAAYRRLGGRYAEVARALEAGRSGILDQVRSDQLDFALLTEAWGPLTAALRGNSRAAAAS